MTFVAFSEDESRIMSLSSDGVIIIMDINLNANELDDNMLINQKHLVLNERDNDYLENQTDWTHYNDNLDMDQQSIEFWNQF